MDMDTPDVRRLHLALAAAGERPSLLPPDPALSALPGGDQPELAAVVGRIAPVAELLFLVMSADGTCGDAERATLRGALRVLSDHQLRTHTVEALLDRFERQLRADGQATRLAHVTGRLSADPLDADAALAAAAAIAVADGAITPDERALLEEVSEALGIGPRRLAGLLGPVDQP